MNFMIAGGTGIPVRAKLAARTRPEPVRRPPLRAARLPATLADLSCYGQASAARG